MGDIVRYSLTSKILSYLIIIVFLNIFVLLAINFFSINSAREEVRQNYTNSLKLFTVEMKNASNFLVSFVNQTESRKFCYLDDETYFIKNTMKNSMYNALYAEKYICGMWIYSNVKDRSLWTRIETYEEFKDFQEVKTVFEDKEKLKQYKNGRWQSAVIGENIYFIYVEYDENICYGAWVNVDQILENAANYFYNDTIFFAICRQDEILGNILYEKSLYSGEDEKEIVEKLQNMNEWRKTTIICPLLPDENINFELLLRLPLTEHLKWIILGITLFGIITIILTIIMCINVKKYLIFPVREIVSGIRKIGAGDLEQRLDTSKYTVELKEIGDNLNQMTQEVSQLKIKVYEEELKKKNALLQFYNVQIRPHFVLNVVNMIYSMASIKEYEGILKTCRYLSGYMRYMFSKKELECSVEEEITHLQEYILLQGMRYPDFLDCRVELEPQILQCRIPTLSLHSLVDNIFKYGIQDQEKLIIWIKGNLLNENNQVKITISDNGPGFDCSVIDAVNQGKIIEQNQRIGMGNTILRFRELYHEYFEIHIENRNGAQIELCFPYKFAEVKGE